MPFRAWACKLQSSGTGQRAVSGAGGLCSSHMLDQAKQLLRDCLGSAYM